MERYLIYRTDFGNTIIRESAVDDSGANEGALFTDFVIPKIQPLYLWRVVDNDVEPNTDENIREWLDEIAPPPSPDDLVTYHQLTGITDNKIDTVTGATDNIAIFTSDGNLQDGGYSIPELTGLTTYTFIGSGSTQVFEDGNEITIYSTPPTGTTVSWGDITGTLSNQTDLQNALNDKLDITDFNSYTGDTEIRLTDIQSDIDSIDDDITGLTATKLDTSVFDTYTGDTQPILDAALTGVTNLGTGTTIGNVDGRDVTLKSISVVGGLSLQQDGDNIIISGETNPDVAWGNITGTLSDQTDLQNALNDKLDITDFNTYSGETETRLQGIEGDISTLSGTTESLQSQIDYISGVTDSKLDITDFNSYTGETETRLQGIEGDIDDVQEITNIALTGATNGLTADGRNVELGGGLTKNTTISGTTHNLTINVQDITLQSTGQISLLDVDGNGVNVESDGGIITLTGNDGLSVEKTKLSISDISMIITDSRDTQTGIVYAGDYSADFIARSLVDKAYVDAVAVGLHPKTGVLVATTENITLSGLLEIDGVQLSEGDRVLVKNQTDAEDNGIYVVTGGAWYRSPDFDGNPDGEVSQGDMIPVISGNTYFNTIWVLVTPNPIVIGTTELEFTKFSSPINLQEGVGVTIVGQTISVDGNSLAGNSITWTGNTFNVDIESGTLATALDSKLDETLFNTYSGDTELRLQEIETDVDNLQDDVTGLTATKLEISDFETYTGETETRLQGIEGDVNYISGVTDTKLDTEIFTGYTATTAANEIFLVHTGGTNLNTIGTTAVEWHEETVDGSLYEWTGGSNIKILEAGNYEITYNLPFNIDNNSNISVGANIIQNSNVVIDVTAAAGMANRINAAGSVALSSIIVTLDVDDVLTLATYRTAQTGNAISAGNGSILIKKKNTLQ